MAYRVQIKAWLDLDKPQEAKLNNYVDWCKRQRLWAATIRDAIRLIADLREGNTTVLLELFPFVREALAGNGAGGDDGKNDAIQRQLDQLERLLLAQDGGQVMAPAGPRPMAIANKPAPPADDDDMPALKVVQAKATGNTSANFLNSAFGLL